MTSGQETPPSRPWAARLGTFALLSALVFGGQSTAWGTDDVSPSPSPTDSSSPDPSPSPTASNSPTDSPTDPPGGGHSKPPGGNGHSSTPSYNPSNPSGNNWPGHPTADTDAVNGSSPSNDGANKTHHAGHHSGSSAGGKTADSSLIDVAHDTLRQATVKAQAATAAARRSQREATQARIAVRRATTQLHDARQQAAHAKAVVGDIAQLMYTNPAGAAWLTDPESAPLVSSSDVNSPATYVEQSQQLATLAESLTSRVAEAEETLQQLETAEQLAITGQDVAKSAAAKARHAKTIALRAQHQAKQVFLRLSGEGRTSSEEAWWITQFASSDLGQMLAGLHGGPHFDMHFVLPNAGEITSPYGMRMHPILHEYRLHTGTDFAGGDGRIHAAAGGTVVRAGYDVAYGNYIVIYHGQYNGRSVATLYAHSAALYVHNGQKVQAGDVIGLIGATGYATGPHLHFEVRLDGRPVDPELFLP